MIGQLVGGMMGRVHKHCKGNGKRYAVIEDGQILNIVHWDPQEAPEWKPLRGVAVAIDADSAAALGICPSCGEPVKPGKRTCGEAPCEAGEAPQPQLLPVAPSAPPEVTPAFYAPPARSQPPSVTNLRMTSLQHILTRAEDGPPIEIPPLPVPSEPLMQPILPPGGKGWRQQAKAAVLDAVSKTNARLAEGRGLYEQALMARNGRVEPLAGLKIAASIQGISTDALIEHLIAEYDAAGRRTNYVHALQVQAIRDIDNAQTGDEADVIARAAIKDIMGEDE